MKSNILILFFTILMISCQNQNGNYACPPCNSDCDKLSFEENGVCPHCNMELVLQSELESELNLVINQIKINNGSGAFLIDAGKQKDKQIKVYYHKPQNFTTSSKVLFVLPGAGRFGRDYRNVWIEASEKHSVLIITLEYSEKYYPEFWNYNLGGMIYDVDINNETFKINQNPETWIFEDFDRIFDLVKTTLNLKTNQYDMFGHSAGGQVLHRLAIFKTDSKADRILASNSGWYTIPTESAPFPYGIGNIQEAAKRLDFSQNLVLFLGENDNANETRGELRRSPEVDRQGLYRLERGLYFYHKSKNIAAELNLKFNWKLEVVPNVGHDYKGMIIKAGEYLYE